MNRPPSAAAAQPLAPPAREPIGFAVRDLEGRGCAFEVDVDASEALVFGSASALHVSAPGVLPAHFVVLPHDGALVAASASAAQPAFLNGAPLPTTWTVLRVPSRVRIGAAAIDFFYLRASGTVLIDQDVETTVADPGTSQVRAVRPTDPARVALAPSPADLARAAVTYARTQWNEATTSTRVLLGVVAVLLVFLVARSGPSPHDAHDHALAPANAMPTGVPMNDATSGE
jgi:hypothetical protein